MQGCSYDFVMIVVDGEYNGFFCYSDPDKDDQECWNDYYYRDSDSSEETDGKKKKQHKKKHHTPASKTVDTSGELCTIEVYNQGDDYSWSFYRAFSAKESWMKRPFEISVC